MKKIINKYCFIGVPLFVLGIIILFTKLPKWLASSLISSGVTIITLNLLRRLK